MKVSSIISIISQSTGGSTGEDEEELTGTCLETKHNTHHNEFLDHDLIEVSVSNKFKTKNNLFYTLLGKKSKKLIAIFNIILRYTCK